MSSRPSNRTIPLESAERTRLRGAMATVPGRAELRDLDLDASELSRHIMAIMTACLEYREALERGSHHDRE